MKGAFTGFTFDGVHSSDLGIVHVANGDRYSERLSADISDLTVEAMGLDGNYFFGSHFGPNHISLNIAYDSVTEEQFRRIRQLFSQKKVSELIFDERPYKKYLVKVESPIELSYVCFDEPKKIGQEEGTGVRRIVNEEGQRVWEPIVKDIYDFSKTQRAYKGEGTIEFVAYFPYAKSVYKTLPADAEDSEWAFSSGLLTQQEYTEGLYDQYNSNTKEVRLYNPGDIPTGIRIFYPINTVVGQGFEPLTITYKIGQEEQDSIVIEEIDNSYDDVGLLIDTDLELIYGVTNISEENGKVTYELASHIYNQFMTAGTFFKIQPTAYLNGQTIDKNEAKLVIEDGNDSMKFLYDYLYL